MNYYKIKADNIRWSTKSNNNNKYAETLDIDYKYKRLKTQRMAL